MAGGQSFLLSDAAAQETLAPSLLLLYGEVEHTGFYEKNNHRWKIASLIKYLWESSQHRVAFRRITSDKESFIKFANGIMNETNHLITTVMQKLPEIREAQEMMKNAQEWGRMTEERQKEIEERLDDSQRQVKSALPLCNRTIQMLGYLNTDADIRGLFLLKELCPRLVQLLLHVMYRLVGSKGLNLKVDHPEQYEFRPKEMLRDLCAVFSLFAPSDVFAEECARSSCDPNLLRQAIKTCRRLNLLVEGEALAAFEALPSRVEAAALKVSQDEQLYADAPDEFLDELMATFMHDPVKLPSGHYVDRSTITQHLLNDSTDPFNRAPLSLEDVEPAIDLKNRMNEWLETKKKNQLVQSSAMDES
jgi:ubiquitin conjugation factor E4 B